MSQTRTEPLLKLVDISRRYESPGGGRALTVLDSIHLEVAAGEGLAIVGPSGSGKSTLLQIMGTLDRPDTGQVIFEGYVLNDLPSAELAQFRNQKIGFVFQAHYLLPQCTVLENVLVPTLPGEPRAEARAELSRRAQQLLARVGLADRTEHRPAQLSGGERQRVAVVRALINRPKLLLADEPTGSLDQGSAMELATLLGQLNREEHVTLVVVTHSRELAMSMGRVQRLRGGKLETENLTNATPGKSMA